MGNKLNKLAKLQLKLAIIEGETWAVKHVLGRNITVDKMPEMNWKIRLMKEKPKENG